MLVTAGISAATILAGCVEEGPEEEDPDDDPAVDDEDDEVVDDEDNEVVDDEANDEANDEEFVEEEPDYDDWFDDVDNYEGTFDMRGEDEVEVMVGAGDDGFDFEPAAIAVSPGTEVVWEWTGEGGAHDVVHADGDAFESDLADEEGHTFEHTFEEDGIYRYVCQPHEAVGMKGAVTVAEEDADVADAELVEDDENDENDENDEEVEDDEDDDV